ncbi:MAG: lamin tail domain-containing protein, partial [Candidatus Nealsonbacteria bacterium]|nr:lamin tail domain-containing protein [Candidatus Nealsonbacteria bacterium]
MENGNQFLKKPNLDKKLFLAVVITTAVFLLGTASIIEAKKVNDKEADEIKTFLKLSNVPFFSKYSEEDIKKLLNLKISAVEISDFTYGLLVLSVKDDIDFMDMILTQAYKQEARDYFNGLLDKKLDLVSHLGNVGKNLYSLAQKGGEVGPYTGLALESVSITNKTIEIFSTFNILKEMKKYDGLWYYFDLRKQGNESHKTAWEEAKIVMGWAAETGSRFKGAGHNNTTQLESQFIALWDKWEPYITPYGISEDYKKQVRNELNDTLITEAERTPVFVKKESGPSFIERYVQQLNRMKELVAGLISQVNPFSAGPIINLPEESPETEIKNEPEKLIEDEPYPTVNLTAKPNLDDMQEDLDDILENLDIVSQETENLLEINSQPDEMTEAESPLIEPGPPSDADLAKEEQKESPETDLAINKGDEVELKDIIKPFCQKIAGDLPLRFRVFINEVGWAGTDNSASDEWIELRNIWGIPVNLNGWQLLDKDGQIKIIFQEKDIIQPNGYYLLERTDDDSIPGVPADLIYSGALNNSNEALYLFDNNCELEDEAEASPDWPGGDNAQKKAMERLDNLYWYTYHGSAQGTPGTENSSPPREYSNTSPVLEAEEEQSFAPQILIPEVQTETGVAAVVINEIAWAGTGASAFDEWIELYNNSTSSIDIAGWRLSSSDVDGPDIVFSTSSAATTTIEAYGFYLIERTNNETISDISAGLMGSFGNGLSNTNCEVLSLYNSNGDLIDKTACSVSDWPGGEASPNYVSMERISVASGTDVGNWASNNLITRNGLDAGGNAINGTPKSENSVSMSFTEISGTLSLEEDLVLTLLGSPYIIEGSITVNEGIKLTIEAGVIIKFKHNSNWHSALNVMGELEAIGGENLDQKIIFTSIYDDEYGGDTNNDGVTSQPAVGDWEWLYLNDAQSV